MYFILLEHSDTIQNTIIILYICHHVIVLSFATIKYYVATTLVHTYVRIFIDPMTTTKALPTNFQQNLYVFEKLKFLEEHEDLRNIVILDYESLSRKQNDLDAILICWFVFLTNYFHIIILVDDISHMPNIHGRQNCTVIEVPSQFLRKVNDISNHIATQIMMCFSNGLFQMRRCRRAYYCLSEDENFPDGFQFMEHTGYEHVYCSVLRSVQDFLDLQYYFRDNLDDPIKMNVCCLLKNNFSRQRYGDKSGKLMFFVRGEVFFRKGVTFLWKELEKFGNTHHFPVSVTTAFPSVVYEVKAYILVHTYVHALFIIAACYYFSLQFASQIVTSCKFCKSRIDKNLLLYNT